MDHPRPACTGPSFKMIQLGPLACLWAAAVCSAGCSLSLGCGEQQEPRSGVASNNTAGGIGGERPFGIGGSGGTAGVAGSAGHPGLGGSAPIAGAGGVSGTPTPPEPTDELSTEADPPPLREVVAVLFSDPLSLEQE
jgi:hypothetical protein